MNGVNVITQKKFAYLMSTLMMNPEINNSYKTFTSAYFNSKSKKKLRSNQIAKKYGLDFIKPFSVINFIKDGLAAIQINSKNDIQLLVKSK
jgi:hypothetical protein